LVGFRPSDQKFLVIPCRFKKRSDFIIAHDANTVVGQCGSILVDAAGKVCGLHFSGSSGDSKFPNEVFAPFGVKK